MKKVVLFVFCILVFGTTPLKAETVLMDDYGWDYHFKDLITVYGGYSIYGLEIVDTNTGDISYGLLAINPSPLSYLHFILVSFEGKYSSFTIQGYWEGNGTVGYMSTNNSSAIEAVTLSIGEQRD
jgi:hypothetical protein